MSKIQENFIEHTQLAIDTIDDLIINGNASITDLDFSINDADEINKSICLNINFEEGRISNSSNVQLYDDETIEHKTNVFKEQMKRSRNYRDKVMSTNDNG
ncbi:hypothetical protein [Staphylococcus gallinarum]|uniref:hypothetical protein n=1 Tax=Staphylococcus gallinarum TaxID=1293 RepID=UPI0030C41162